MATTTNYALTLLEVGQKEKEVTINTNFQTLDSVPKFLVVRIVTGKQIGRAHV